MIIIEHSTQKNIYSYDGFIKKLSFASLDNNFQVNALLILLNV